MLFLPIADDNPTRRTPFVTWTIMGLCVVVFLWQQSLAPVEQRAALYSFGVVPTVLFGNKTLPPELAVIPGWLTVVTSMFMHGGWLHLGGNLLYLWIFGNNVEDSMGHGRFIAFYLVCGTAAALAQSLPAPFSEIPMVGASGAIAGVLGAYLILHPRANVRVFLWIIILIRIINVPAFIVLGGWFLMQFISGANAPVDAGGVAFLAHMGGFVAGAALIPVFRSRGVPLWSGARSRAFTVTRPRELRGAGSVPNVDLPPRHREPPPPPRRRGPWG
ncbi:rhomboid family serine protease [Caenispirillum salinarum AK4]|uniref:Rhomboid family serine protease n=1 Tax=Caenispirillum salinarum AK4 TaxID=1238182 RepID=K9H191_9PROT|nr:rhomboid family intramembrane serine protease [Caenispirillum salinarum]EKV32025.1 rhomboid family serine protease [Caenispirillum salinarum AK4]